jgi:metal-responsive CopG/Arc/MetJ family transcriptional regulator
MVADNDNNKNKFLFNTDILIEADSNGRALEKLLHILNSKEINDYLIKEGIQLGETIEKALRETISKATEGKHQGKREGKAEGKSTAAERDVPESSIPGDDPHRHIWEQFHSFKQKNTLIRLSVVKGKGVKLSMPCRIINVDSENGNVSVYHVDEKQVYLFNINEIDDFTVNK